MTTTRFVRNAVYYFVNVWLLRFLCLPSAHVHLFVSSWLIRSSLCLQLEDVSSSFESLTPAPLHVSHRDVTGVRLFVMELGAVGHSRANEKIKCPVSGCFKELADAAAALQHSAHHILHTPTKLSSSKMCPLCFGPSTECPPFLYKANSSLQPKIPCLKALADCRSRVPIRRPQIALLSVLSATPILQPMTTGPRT